MFVSFVLNNKTSWICLCGKVL